MTRAGILLSLSLLVGLVVVGVSLAAAQPVQPPVNLLPNPSFEQPQTNAAELAAHWAPYQCGYTRTRELNRRFGVPNPGLERWCF